MAKKRHISAYEKATKAMEKEGYKQCMLLYSAAALALHRHWGKGKQAIISLFELTGDVWRTCAEDNSLSMIQMCEDETGIEIQNSSGRSWRDLPYLNATLDNIQLSSAQWVYMRHRQKDWIAAQVMACIMVGLHRKYGFGFDRCARIYQQIRDIEAEYNFDVKKLQEACEAEALVNVYDVITQKKEPGKVV